MTCAGGTYIVSNMLKSRVPNYLLTIALLACPLQSHADEAVCARGEATATCGSDDAGTETPVTGDHTCTANHSDRPSRGCPADGESCQCICAGALIERPASESLGQTDVGAGLVNLAPAAVVGQRSHSSDVWIALPLHGAANHGHAVCLWHHLWRC